MERSPDAVIVASVQNKIKQIDEREVRECKDRIRPELKKEKSFNSIDDIIRKILLKTDADPTKGNKCVRWIGPKQGTVVSWGKTYYIRRMLYQWYVGNLDGSHNVVNDSRCEFNMCCNINHLKKMHKKASYEKEGKDYYGASHNLARIKESTKKRKSETKKVHGQNTRETKKSRLSPDRIKNVWNKLKGGETVKKVAEACEVSKSTVRHVAKGTAWNSITGLPAIEKNNTDESGKIVRAEKRRENYLKKYCSYKLRKDLPEKEIPKKKELYRIIKNLGEPFTPLKISHYSDELYSKEHCIYAPKMIKYRGRRIGRARLIFHWFNSEIPEGNWVVKRCEERKNSKGVCIRPEHLCIVEDDRSSNEEFSDSFSDSSGDDSMDDISSGKEEMDVTKEENTMNKNKRRHSIL